MGNPKQIDYLGAFNNILGAQTAAMQPTFEEMMKAALAGQSAERTGAIKFLEKDGTRARAAASFGVNEVYTQVEILRLW